MLSDFPLVPEKGILDFIAQSSTIQGFTGAWSGGAQMYMAIRMVFFSFLFIFPLIFTLFVISFFFFFSLLFSESYSAWKSEQVGYCQVSR